MSKEKKKFKDSKLGKFLSEKLPQYKELVGEIPIAGPILEAVLGKIQQDPDVPEETKAEILKLKQEHDKEMYSLEIEDRNSARNREIEIAKAGGNDHLMYVAGYVALAAFLGMICAVIFLPENITHNSLFHQLMGIIEGVALTVFSYYFGTSKSSADKTKILGK